MLDGNGVMTDNFKVGELDPSFNDDLLNGTVLGVKGIVREKVERYKMCDLRMVDYVPCLDNEELLKRLNESVRGEKYERHCPEDGMGLKCLVPKPKGYRKPILWPQSRDEVLFGFGFCKFFLFLFQGCFVLSCLGCEFGKGLLVL